MNEKIKLQDLAGNISLVTNPELIKVKTIKKKFVDQMGFLNLRYDDPVILDRNLKFLGRCAGYVVMIEDGEFLKISQGDLHKSLIEAVASGPAYGPEPTKEQNREIYDKAHDIMDKIPQLFHS